MNKTKALVLFTVFIDIVGFGIVIPVLPFYVRSLGASDTVITLLFATFAILSFFSSPLLGTLSDRLGRRPILIVSILSTAIGWLVFAAARSLPLLFLGRIIDGLAAGNITTAQSFLADIAKTDQERTTNLGLVGAMWGIGLIVGPILGGALAHFGTSIPFWFVGFLASLNTILAFFFLPETHHVRTSARRISLNPFTPILDGFRHPEMRTLFFVWLLFGIGISIQQSIFALYLNRIFGLDETSSSLLFGLTGILILFNQTVLLKRVWLAKFQSKGLAEGMLFCFGISMALLAVPTFGVFLAGLIVMTFCQGTLRAIITSLIAGYDPTRRGEHLGISSSFMSLSMIIGPLLATALFASHPSIPYLVAATLGIAGFAILRLFPLHQSKKNPIPENA